MRATAGNRIYSSWVGSCHGNPQQTQCLTQSAQWNLAVPAALGEGAAVIRGSSFLCYLLRGTLDLDFWGNKSSSKMCLLELVPLYSVLRQLLLNLPHADACKWPRAISLRTTSVFNVHLQYLWGFWINLYFYVQINRPDQSDHCIRQQGRCSVKCVPVLSIYQNDPTLLQTHN